MYVAINTISMKKGYGGELEERFSHGGAVAQEPGFRWFQLWKLDGDGDAEEYLVVTQWNSQEAHAQWTQSESFKRTHSGPPLEGLLGRPESRGYDVRHAFSAAEPVAGG